MSEDHGQDDRLDAAEVARMLGVSKATIYDMLEQGKLAGFVVGVRRKKIYRWSVDKWIAEHSFGAIEPAADSAGPAPPETKPERATVPKQRTTKKKK